MERLTRRGPSSLLQGVRQRPPSCCHLPTFTLVAYPDTEYDEASTELTLEVCGCWFDDESDGGGNTFVLYDEPGRGEDRVNEATRLMLGWIDARGWDRIGDGTAIERFIAAHDAGLVAIFKMYTAPPRD